jgi:hypothetical protein
VGFVVIFFLPLLLACLVAAQCSIARRAILARDTPGEPWAGVLSGSTVAAPLFAIAALWVRHVAQSALDSALHVNRATTTIVAGGMIFPAYAAIHMGEQIFAAMLVITAIGAAVYFNVELVTRRLRTLNIVLWSLAGFVLLCTMGLIALFMSMPVGRRKPDDAPP